MYQEFSILTLETNIVDKQIIVTANNTIDPNNVNEINVELYERETKAHMPYSLAVNGNKLIVTLKEWPVPNSSYIFYLKTLNNVLGQPLKSGIKRRLTFESDITKEVEIISPSMHEKVDVLNVKLNIFDKTDIKVDVPGEKTRIELSTDTMFNNIIKHTSTINNSITLSDIPSGQYFIRARIEANDKKFQYSKWSKVITFFYGDEKDVDIDLEESEDKDEYIPDYEDMLPIIEDDIEELEFTMNCKHGQTPDVLLLKANKMLDEDNFEQTQISIMGKVGFERFDAKVYEDTIKITLEDGFKDNTVYEIALMGIKSVDGDSTTTTLKLTTKIKPLYCDVFAVKALIGEYKIDDDIIIFNIKEASKFADYITQNCEYPFVIDENDVPFMVQQFVKYYAAHECLLRHTIDISSTVGLKGTVGNVNFSESESTKDITSLLKHFCAEIDKWKEALKGYELEGRARVRSGVRGKYASPETTPLALNQRYNYGRGNVYGGTYRGGNI